MTDGLGISGLQEAQRANEQVIAALKPENGFGKAVQYVTAGAHRYAVSISHVWAVKGGGLRASHRMAVDGLWGVVYVDPAAVNPRGQAVSAYAPAEEARGGQHAFYKRTINEAGPGLVDSAWNILYGGLP